MDYIDYINNQIQKEYEIADEMEKLGITDYDEYIEYIEDAKACAQIAHYEAIEGR